MSNVLLPTFPDPVPLSEAVLFAFDDHAFPFRAFARTHLLFSGSRNVAVEPGPPGSHDELIGYYGTTLKIGDTFHMWYQGNSGPIANMANRERKEWRMSYATSKDGLTWEKPELGLVEFNGSKRNNIVDFPATDVYRCASVILHDPEDPDPSRRFKMIYEAVSSDLSLYQTAGSPVYWSAAFSPDGLRWTLSDKGSFGACLEMSGLTRHRGLYYVNGHVVSWPHSEVKARRLCTYVSADFEHWSPISALGLDRAGDLTGPSTAGDVNLYEEVHLGAALWNRGNVILGIYGQWHGHPTRDRRLVSMDLGLAISHDALHFREPIPGFAFIHCREPAGAILGFHPGLMQGQGMVNHGERTFYWYSNWRTPESAGVFMSSWGRDRLGLLKPFRPFDNLPGCLATSARPPHRVVTCPIQITQGQASVYLNADGLGPHSNLRVALVDEGFRTIAGCAGQDAAVIDSNGFRTPVRWKQTPALLRSHGRVRLDITFDGLRAEDGRLYAAYVGEEPAAH